MAEFFFFNNTGRAFLFRLLIRKGCFSSTTSKSWVHTGCGGPLNEDYTMRGDWAVHTFCEIALPDHLDPVYRAFRFWAQADVSVSEVAQGPRCSTWGHSGRRTRVAPLSTTKNRSCLNSWVRVQNAPWLIVVLAHRIQGLPPVGKTSVWRTWLNVGNTLKIFLFMQFVWRGSDLCCRIL